MKKETLENIKEEYRKLRENAIKYLTVERSIYEENTLKNKDTYTIFSLFLKEYLPRLYDDVEKEASCLPAAITTQMALSLGWMDEQYQLLSKEIKWTKWGRTPSGGTYEKVLYLKEEQKEIMEYIKQSFEK